MALLRLTLSVLKRFFLERGDGTRDPEKTERRDRNRAALGQIGLLNI